MSDEPNQPDEAPQLDEQKQPEKESKPDVPPDRLSLSPLSKHFDEEKLKRGIGIRFKGVVRKNVQEYCISEGWITIQMGKTVDRRGQPLTIKSKGPVEAWYEDLGEDAPVASMG